MSKRTLCQLVTMFLLGIGWGAFSYWGCLVGGICFMGFLLWHVFSHYDSKFKGYVLLGTALTFLLFGAFRGYLYQEKNREIQTFLSDAIQVSFQGEISKKEIKANQIIYYLQRVTLQNEYGQIVCPSLILYPESDENSIGTILKGTAKYQAFEPKRNQGNFDAQAFYLSKGVYGKLIYPQVETFTEPRYGFLERLYQFKNNLVYVYERYLPGEEAGIMSAIALGEKGLLDLEAKELFQAAGIAHILAISGLHISVVGMFLYGFLRKRGICFLWAGIISATVVMAYGFMCGMGSSLVRAIIMYFILLLADVLGEAYDSLTGLALAAFLMVLYNPGLLKNSGVWFSFMAVAGVVTVGKKLSVDFGGEEKRKWRQSVGMALGIQLFTLPLVALFYYEIPIYVMGVNLILLPMMGILLGTGLIGGVAGLWFPLVGKGLLEIAHLVIFGYEWVAAVSLKLPGALQIVGAPALWKVVLYYMLLSGVCYGKDRIRLCNGRIQRSILQGVLLCVPLLFFVLPGKKDFEIDVLDVGQGDGTFVQSDKGTTFFVDGGSSDEKQVGKYRILPFLKYRGVRRIDYWFVSHTDEDHISGVTEVLERGYPVGNLVFSNYVIKNQAYRELRDLAQKNGTKVRFMSPNDVCMSKTWRWTCLAPAEVEEETNADSMVLLFEQVEKQGDRVFRGLFTGDMGIEQEMELVNRLKLQSVDYLKVAHHGSKNSTGKEFLEAIQPKIATISCGTDNFYGHPHTETLKRLKEVGTSLYRTDLGGQIRIDAKEGVCYIFSIE